MTAPVTAAFAPRRLAHVNMWVSDRARSLAFYRDVCGLRTVFDEPGIGAVFLSNGNSHHDLALMQTMTTDRIGRQGQVQIPRTVGNAAGLNHLGFEMETEAALVRGHRAATEEGLRTRTVDHQISRSVYLHDPDGNYLEFYADSPEDWREVYRRAENELLTSPWTPGEQTPDARPRYATDPPISPGDGHLRPERTARAVFCVADLDRALAFYTGLLGLRVLHRDAARGFAALGGTVGLPHVGLIQRPEAVGLHHFGLELADLRELRAGRDRLAAAGLDPVAEIDAPGKRSLVLRDPDGVLVEFFVAGPGRAEERFALPGEVDAAYFL